MPCGEWPCSGTNRCTFLISSPPPIRWWQQERNQESETAAAQPKMTISDACVSVHESGVMIPGWFLSCDAGQLGIVIPDACAKASHHRLPATAGKSGGGGGLGEGGSPERGLVWGSGRLECSWEKRGPQERPG